jgi:hypothetical protein
MDYLELIARVTSHFPDKGQLMVRYYGLYANALKLTFVADNPPLARSGSGQTHEGQEEPQADPED